MEFQDVVRRRRMVRNFADRPLAPEVVERILANGGRAPSAGFTQGWAFLVLQGAEETARFWAACPPPEGSGARTRWPGVLRAPLLVVVLGSESAYRRRYAEPDKAASGLADKRWPVPYWHVDAGFAALLMLLTAVDAGLGALFFGVSDHDGLRRAFGVPGDWTPVGAVAVGYPEPDAPSPSLTRGRRPLEDVVHRGRW
ncbi:MAG TPA: nitroreductase family protein [Acidimicrobiales bacterium]|nr:nitroreductase family protein [Acidimicrobiales bacterium]